MNSKYNLPVMLLGNEKHTNEPEQIVMNSYDLNVDGDEDISVPAKHIALQKVIDDYSENSSIENGSLCEMNCIPCYNGDKRSQSYNQKVQYYTTIGKDECPRIFDINQYAPFNEQFNNFSPRKLKTKSFSNSTASSLTQPELLPVPNQNLQSNGEYNEAYYSDASVETNATYIPSDPNYFIKTYTSNTNNETSKPTTDVTSNIKENACDPSKESTPLPLKGETKPLSKSRRSRKNSYPFRQTIPTIFSQEELKGFNEIDLRMSPLKQEINGTPNIPTDPTNTENIDLNSQNIQTPPSKLKLKNVTIKDTNKKDRKDKTKIKSKSKKHRSSVSKYDFVKVLVYLSGEHYYVLSRFLISRMLTATQVDYYHAVRIALDLKKYLVDCDELELSQKKLEKNLFKIMKEYGYNEKNIVLYKLLSAFYRERIPMIILISGPRCVGKSTLATKLAERLNLPNIVKTDTVYDLMCSIFNIPEEDREPIWYRNCSTEELLEKYEKDCELVKKGLEADIKKAFTEGKSIIIEGTHVNHILHDFVLDCITKFNNQQNEDKSKSSKNDISNTYSSQLLTISDNPCNAIVLPFYLDMDDKKSHEEFLYNQMMKEILINNQNDMNPSYYFMSNVFPGNINFSNDQLREFKSKIDIIGNLFNRENDKRQYQMSSLGESKAFKYINVDPKSFENTLNVMHNEVLNKIQEKFSISE